MGPYNYSITLSDGRIITIGSSTPMDADEIREVQRKYNAEIEAAEGGPLRVAGRTLMQTSAGVIKGGAYTASGLLDLIGATGAAEEFEKVGKVGEEMSAMGRSLAPESFTGKVTGAIGETGGMLLPMIAGGIATGGASVPVSVPLLVGGGLGFAQKYGGRLSQLKELETTRLRQEFPRASEADLQIMARGQAMGPALQSAAFTGALTMLGGVASRAFGAGGGLDTGNILRDLSAKGGQSAWKVAAKGGLIEGLEEFTDEALDIAFIDKGIPLLDYRARYHPELGHESAVTRLASAFALGSFFGAGFSGLGAKAENIRANKELLQMTEDIKRIIGPKVEARWMKDAGLSDETVTLMEQGRRGGIRHKWIDEALQIKGKKTIRNREAIGRLRELEQTIDEDIRADYITDPNSNLTVGEKRILRKAGLAAEEEIVSLLEETNTSSVEELVEGIKSGKKQILGAELQTLMDETGSTTVEELFRKMTTKPEPAPRGEIDVATGVEQAVLAPTTRAEVFPPLTRQEGGEGIALTEQETAQLDAIRKMEEQAARKGPMPETFGKPLAPVKMQTAGQEFGYIPRRAAQVEGEAARAPDFTGPSAIAAQPPDVAVPPVPSKAADLGAILEGPEMRTTRAERRALKKEEKGIIRTVAEIKTIKDFRRKLEAWQKKREATRGARGYEFRASGITDEAAIDAGIAAGIAAAKAGESVGAALDAAVKAYKKASKEKVTINVSDLRDELANRIEGELSTSPAALSTETSADLIEQAVSQDIIETRNLSKWRSLLDDSSHHSELTSEQQLEAEQELYRQLNDNETVGNLSLENLPMGAKITSREMAQEAINAYDVYNGDMSESRAFKLSEDLGITYDEASDIFATLNQFSSSSEAAIGRRIREAAAEHSGGEVGEAPSLTRKKLVKMRNAIRKWRRGRGLSLNALDVLGAKLIEDALSIAIKILETTGSMKKALAGAYASLGETSISKKDFDSAMTGRMTAVLELVDDGTKYEDAVAATRYPLEGLVPFQIFESSAWSKGGVPLTLDEGETVEFASTIETATPLPVREEEGLPDETVEPVPEGAIPYAAYKLRWGKNTGLKLWNNMKRFFVTNLSYGASDLAKRMGVTETLNTMYVTLGKQMDNQVELRDKYMARLRVMLFENGPAPYETASKKEKEVADIEFEAYQKKLFYRKKDDPMPSTEGLSEVGKGVIEGWKKVAEFTGTEMVDARIRVRLPNGKYRYFKKIGETFWGRMMLPKYAHALNSLTPRSEGITVELEEFGKILKRAGEIDRISVQNIRKWWWEETGKTARRKKTKGEVESRSQDANRAGAEQTAFFSGVDKARTKDEPLGEAMDFTLGGGGRWIYNWSNRMSQVNAYGQKTGGPKGQKDYFDTILDKLELEGIDNSDEDMQFVYRQRKSAYDLMEGTFAENLVALSGKVATLTMLTGYFNAIRNLTGWGPTAAVFGMSNSFKGMAKLVEYADAAKQSRAWGTLQNNAELLLAGQDISGGPTHALDKAVKWGLSKTLFTAAENTVRIHAGFTASAFVTEGIDAVKKENNPGLAEEFKDMALRFDTDPDIIIREDNPMGEETSKFIRRAVKEVQGGYRFNQLPSWMQTNTGRFLNKFGSYGLQITRAIRRNALEPIMKDPTNIRKWLPLMRFIGTAAMNGELLYAIRDLIFGKERPDETLAEIVKGETPMADLFWRMVNNMTYAGTLGIIGDFSGMARSVATKRRVRNPFEPAGAAVVSNSLLWINNAIREEKLSLGAFYEAMSSQFALVRYGKPALTQAAGRLGAEWDAVKLQDAKEDRNFLRNATRRFQESVGGDVKNMIGAPTYARSPFTQYYSDVKDELMIGDVKDSREAALRFAEALDPEDRDGAWARLTSSISASQPMKIGDARNKEIKMEFISWARRNLSEADVERILKVQSTYMDTARNTGLISGGDEQVLRSMKILMNLKAPKGRKRSRKESTDPVMDALKRHEDFMEKALGR